MSAPTLVLGGRLAWAGLDADHIAAAARRLLDTAEADRGLSQEGS